VKIPKPVCHILAAILAAALPANRALAAGALPPAEPFDLERQVLDQGPMLLSNLRQAREEGLRRDPWGMVYSLQEARRLLHAMTAAERSPQPGPATGGSRPTAGNPAPGTTVPLGEPVEVDRPESGGRELEVKRFDGEAGTIALVPMDQAIGRALTALNGHPPALGAALLATEDALGQVHWAKGTEPKEWASARDQALEGFALALDGNPKARPRLEEAHKVLSGLPGGEQLAGRLATILAAPAPDLGALSALVRDLDVKVSGLRRAAEVAP
jgi:hypothetical protein